MSTQHHPSPGAGDAGTRAPVVWSASLLLIAAATGVLLWCVTYVRVVVVAVAAALLLAALLAPVAAAARRLLRIPAWAAAMVPVLGLPAAAGALLVGAGRTVAAGLGDLARQADEGLRQLRDALVDGPLPVGAGHLDALLHHGMAALRDHAGVLLSGALATTVSAGQVLAGTATALFCAYFFVQDGRLIWSWLVGLLPRSVRDRVHDAGHRGFVVLAACTRAQLVVAAVDAVGIGVGAAVLRVPLAVPVAVLACAATCVPLVGALVAGAVAVLVALVAHGPVTAALMLAVVLVVHLVEGAVLQPLLVGRAVALHPVAVVLVVSAGVLSAGVVGALLAVPVAATLTAVVRHLRDHGPASGTQPGSAAPG